jgi:hypothetical protein
MHMYRYTNGQSILRMDEKIGQMDEQTEMREGQIDRHARIDEKMTNVKTDLWTDRKTYGKIERLKRTDEKTDKFTDQPMDSVRTVSHADGRTDS